MRAGVGHGLEILFGGDACLLQVVARHQAARGGGGGAEGKGLALEVVQRLDGGAGRDELGREFGVLGALHDGGGRALGADAGLHVGKAAQPGHVDLVAGQRLDHGSVVGHGDELHLHAGFGFQVLAQRGKLALQFGGGFVGNGGNAQHLVGSGSVQGREGGCSGGNGQRATQRQTARGVGNHGNSDLSRQPLARGYGTA